MTNEQLEALHERIYQGRILLQRGRNQAAKAANFEEMAAAHDTLRDAMGELDTAMRAIESAVTDETPIDKLQA